MSLFHGGVRRLHRGDVILPPAKTGAASTADYGAAHVCRRDRVYLTTDEGVAEIFACCYPAGRGDLYEVEPIGELEPDPDCNELGLGFQAPMARVLRVVKRNVTECQGLSREEVLGLLTPDGDRYVAAERAIAEAA
jgi:hypothetical protein